MAAIGVDIGGTKIAFALVNREGHILAQSRTPTEPERGAESLYARVAQGVRALMAQSAEPVDGVGVGCPGYVDSARGVVLKAVNLGWESVPLKDALSQQLDGLPVQVRNDVGAAAHGERMFGAGRACDDFVYLAVGTGLGASAFSGGRAVAGAHFAAMELGHIGLNPHGRACPCGLHGCPEAYASGVGLLAGAREYLPHMPQSALHACDPLTTADILHAAQGGDPLAQKVITEAGEQLAQVLVFCVGALNPARFIVGGGLGLALFDRIAPVLRSALTHRALPAASAGVDIVPSQVESSAVGAASLVWG